MLRRVGWCAIAFVLACAPVSAQEGATAPAAADSAPPPPQTDELAPCPPPEGSCAQDVVGHVLTDTVGSWERQGEPVVGAPSAMPSISEYVRALFATYPPVCGSEVGYRNTTGPGTATVTMLTFETTLDALGFFDWCGVEFEV